MKVEELTQILFRIVSLFVVVGLIFFLSVGIYAGFYNSLVPQPIHEGPAHFLFEPCEEKLAKCGFLNASVILAGQNQRSVLMAEQDYVLSLSLEMPESPVNRDLGMFMTCAQMMNKNRLEPARKTCKSSILKYKSDQMRMVELLFTWPAILTNYHGEKQIVHIQFFDDYREDPMNPLLSIDFQVMSRHAEIYSAKFQVQAKFSGLRYVLYHFPVTSAILGLSFNMTLLTFILLLSWFRLSPKQSMDLNERASNPSNLDSGLRGELVTDPQPLLQ